MKFANKMLSFILISAFAVSDLSAAPRTPIGGIIVKGGKNPGGQMLVRATTDSNGSFTVNFTEGGEYSVEFERPNAGKNSGGKVDAEMQLDYTMQTSAKSAGRRSFSNKTGKDATIITVPEGGAIIKGTLRSSGSFQAPKAVPKAITQSGIK